MQVKCFVPVVGKLADRAREQFVVEVAIFLLGDDHGFYVQIAIPVRSYLFEDLVHDRCAWQSCL